MQSEEFKKRFLPFHDPIFKIAYSFVGNRDDAKDITQEVFLKLWEKRDALNHIRNDQAYVCTLTKNCAVDFIRSSSRISTQSITDDTFASYSNSAEEEIDAKERLSNTLRYIRELPKNQQDVIRLRHFAGMSFSEIAEAMQLKEANIRQLLSRARRRLRVKLNNNL